jgi:hypothetical protein
MFWWPKLGPVTLCVLIQRLRMLLHGNRVCKRSAYMIFRVSPDLVNSSREAPTHNYVLHLPRIKSHTSDRRGGTGPCRSTAIRLQEPSGANVG